MPPVTPGDINSVVNQVNQNIAKQNTDAITKIVKDDTGTRRVLSGKGDNGFYGFKVSKANKDVFTAADSDLIFNSDQNVFKIVASGYMTIPAYSVSSTAGNFTTNFGSVVVDHNLGFAPAILAYYFDGSEYFPVPFSNPGGSGVNANWLSVNAYTTPTQVAGSSQTTVYGARTINNPSLLIKYYLLQETAN